MKASDHDGGVNQTEEETANGTSEVVDVLQAARNGIAQPAHGGTHGDEGEETSDQQCQHRGDQEVYGAFEVLVEEFFHHAQNPRDQQDRQHGALVTSLGDVEAEQIPVGHAACFDGLCHFVTVD